MPRPLCWLALLLLGLAPLAAAPEFVYVGTFTNKREAASHSDGIYVLRFDPATGTLAGPALAAAMFSPCFLTLSPDHRRLYAVEERSAGYRGPGGGVSAFAVDPATGALTLIDRAGTGGYVHVAIDAVARLAITADYGGGTVGVFPLLPDGGVGAPAILRETGPAGPDPVRQAVPHAHSTSIAPDDRFAFVCNLGLDRVFIYRVDADRGVLTPNDPPFAALPPGSGPRHSKFSTDGRFFYVANELGSTVSVFAYDAARGALELRQTVRTVPADFHGDNAPAEIRVHPNGRFVYVSNRGHDSLAVLARDPAAGTLSVVQIIPCGGKYPRNFNLSPDGRWLLCANRDSDNVVVFGVDPASGRLAPTGVSAHVPQPVCILFGDRR